LKLNKAADLDDVRAEQIKNFISETLQWMLKMFMQHVYHYPQDTKNMETSQGRCYPKAWEKAK